MKKLNNHELNSIVEQIVDAAKYDYELTDWFDLTDRDGYYATIEYYRFDTVVTLRGTDINVSGRLESYDSGKTFDIISVDVEIISGEDALLDDYTEKELYNELSNACYYYFKP